MGGDDRSGITSVTSGYHSHISASEAPSDQDSEMSAATSSFMSGTQRGHQTHNRSVEENKASSDLGEIQKKEKGISRPCKVS